MRGITLGVLSQQNPEPKKLVEYSFNDQTFGPSFVANGITASSIVGNNLDNLTISTTLYDTPSGVVSATSTSINQSYALNKYFSIVLTGIKRITKIEFQATRGGSSIGRGFGIKSSFNNFNAPLFEIDNIPTARPVMTLYQVQTNIYANDLEIRFYFTTPGSTQYIDFDNIIIYGN